MRDRDRSIDISRGVAILFVLLGHSILYHPIQMASMYHWCYVLDRIITSFNMPMFFLISGYLFSKTHKSTGELYWNKTLRILVPYLFIMLLEIVAKLFIPSDYSFNKAAYGGILGGVKNALLYGGDRWFFYTLFIMFLILIPVRKLLKKKWFDIGLIVFLTIIYFLGFMPKIFLLNKVFYFMVFFVAGYLLSDYYINVKTWSLKYWWAIYPIAMLFNIVFIITFDKIPFVYRFVLPFTGSIAMMTLAFQLEKIIERSKVVKYIEYCGLYSLQFYLFPSGVVVRVLVINVLQITNPFLILFTVFVLQLLVSTILVEITRRIKWLKIPCGY